MKYINYSIQHNVDIFEWPINSIAYIQPISNIYYEYSFYGFVYTDVVINMQFH